MPSTVIVTGAAGYVGRHVVRAVADLGFHPLALVRQNPGKDLDQRASVAQADVLDPAFDLSAIVPTEEVASVIHLAWQNGFVHNAPSHLTGLSAHYAFLTHLADQGVPRIAVLGTMHEVGYWEGPITAEAPTNPVTLYGIAKDALRRSAFVTIGHRSEVLWMRAFYITGDDRRNHSIFTKLLEASDRGEATFPFTTGRTLYDFIDVEELGRQIAVAATTRGVCGVINTCTGNPESLAVRAERFIEESGLELRLDYGAFPERSYDSPGLWGDATAIAELMAASAFGKGVG